MKKEHSIKIKIIGLGREKKSDRMKKGTLNAIQLYESSREHESMS